MSIVFDVPQNDLILKVSGELKKFPEIKAPEWASFAKTGAHKERPPVDEEWWHMRAAAILRSIYKLGPIGVSKLRTKYGGKKNRGVKAEKFYKGSGSVARKILQQLEKAGLIKYAEKGVHKGRIITPKGTSILDRAALELGAKKTISKKVTAPVKVAASKPAAEKAKPETKEKKETTPKPKAEKKTEEKKTDDPKKKDDKVPSTHELAKKKEEAKKG
ncbi:MAG: 30S ribosomal protein S19e [bacterium]|nr:30S ribosomal protein S19e [bacterium]